MNYNILTIDAFDKQLKKLSKKYPSIKSDLIEFIKLLQVNPGFGIPIGQDCYKYRLSIKSKNKGKSSGARLIAHIYYSDNNIYLLSLYDKSEIITISDNDIKNLIGHIVKD